MESPRRRRPLERFAAWLATGPVGHLVAGFADWLEALARYGSDRLRRRLDRRR